jgi:predicted dinucleotide-binding enzyme
MIVVDATTAPAGVPRAGSWVAAIVPRPRVVRAFASLPAQALRELLLADRPRESAALSVPLAGDDRDAKAVVGRLVQALGLEPFDLGALDVAELLDPGGPLWRQALTALEMLEAVGELSGDG